jgi:type III restriction enzyme
MQFKFDANQDFQIAAVESAVDLFEGQPNGRLLPSLSIATRQLELAGAPGKPQIDFAESLAFAAVDNRLALDDAALLENLQTVQAANDLPQDVALQFIEEKAETLAGEQEIRFANFSVEMETGTGKTYVYVRTALELFRRYGFRKFIIVVPSVAVREGVLKTFQMTERHFRELFSNTPYRYYIYDSENLSQVRQFATSAAVEFMVMTIDSFNKATNVIRQQRDQLQGETPIHLIQATRPILILDEPQNMESELRVKALAALNPLLALRYSATHRNPYNVVYRLTPFEAYRQGLVKRIEVAGVEKEGDANQVFMRLMDVRAVKTKLTARLAVHQLRAKGDVKETIVTVGPGESLETKTNRPEYAPFVVEEITDQSVIFGNGIELRVGEAKGADKEAIFESQIRYTIEAHFRKQEAVKAQGVKVLSLFFIDRVDNYAKEDGIIRSAFKKAFNELKAGFLDWKDADCEKVQAAYFASRKTKAGEVIYEDTRGESEKDSETYDLIMRDKERLLSFSEPVAFIFSHSALREGWDNPNVFQICTLNQTVSEMKKRQEIGRGIRLAVNQSGDRLRDDKVNVLTVVANENYESYVARYQGELEEAYGASSLPPKPANARKRGTARLVKAMALKPEFKKLWEKIRHKTRYSVEIDSENLISEVVAKLDSVTIAAPRLNVRKARVVASEAEDKLSAVLTGSGGKDFAIKRDGLPNLVEVMASLMENTTPPVRLTRRTLLEIFKRTKNRKAALANPHEFATVAVRFIKFVLADQLVEGVRYEKINEWYEMTQLEQEIPSWKEYLVASPTSIYDHVIFNSEIERNFVEGLEKDKRVRVYLKLPAWFTVTTPVGEYNPDWAIVMDDVDAHGKTKGERLYLVRETKDTSRPDSMRPNEQRKIDCGKRHFKDALGVNYRVIKSAAELPGLPDEI